MEPDTFLRQAELLTGTPVKGTELVDQESLAEILQNDSRSVDCSQLNELLLLVHKDRVEGAFFDYFFGSDCTVGKIPDGVERFQKTAMLRYGNFVFAYRTLSRIKTSEALIRGLDDAAKDPTTERGRFHDRKPKLLEIDQIKRESTPFVGYLSAGQVRAEVPRCDLMLKAADLTGKEANWEAYAEQVQALASEVELPVLREIVQNFRLRNDKAAVRDFIDFLNQSLSKLKSLRSKVGRVQQCAKKNQQIYLTWDHMDVYFATSMRKAWEYEDLYDFIEKLTASSGLQELDVRYFDPTQSLADNRVDKGLVEALMLKRARCTVYSVQDTDTLGKDSELASTLAQGKPVIAYVPDLDVDARTAQLAQEDPGTILERLRFVLYADDQVTQRLSQSEYALVDKMQDKTKAFADRWIWLSVPDLEEAAEFRSNEGQDLVDFCRIIAGSEKVVYDKRAKTLRETHPLAIQVHLDTGVANGVLVVRSISDCAALLRRILLYDMVLILEEKDDMWYLREQISGCIYRVVTKDRKLNNCFWNFYLR